MSWIQDLADAGLNALNKKTGPMFGIDVSKWNGKIRWNEVATNEEKVDFAIIRSTEGVGNRDPMLVRNVAGAINAGIPWTCYHFATWNKKDAVEDATEEANEFIEVINALGTKPSMKLVLDTESNKDKIILTPPEVVVYIKTFESVLLSAGYEMRLYIGNGFVDGKLPKNHGLGYLDLWLTHFNKKPRIPNGWKEYWAWQYTEEGRVKGIDTKVDLNRSLKSVF